MGPECGNAYWCYYFLEALQLSVINVPDFYGNVRYENYCSNNRTQEYPYLPKTKHIITYETTNISTNALRLEYKPKNISRFCEEEEMYQLILNGDRYLNLTKYKDMFDPLFDQKPWNFMEVLKSYVERTG